jgi:hypothetical protein
VRERSAGISQVHKFLRVNRRAEAIARTRIGGSMAAAGSTGVPPSRAGRAASGSTDC